jgi:prepilin-type N-terminal cleavage/methylation domain-containing protein
MNQEAVNTLPFEAKNQAVNQKGYSIIELSIALAIISIILVGSLAGVQRVLRSNNLNNELKSAQLGLANLTTFLATTNSTSGLTSSGAVTLKLFDGLQIDTGNSLYKNNFGGFIYTESNKDAIGANLANSGFIYATTNIPQEICSDYLSGLASVSTQLAAGNSYYLSSGKLDAGNQGKMAATVVKDVGGSIDLSKLANACAVTGTNPKLVVTAFIGRS